MQLDAVLSIRFVLGSCSGAAPVREKQVSILTTSSREGNFENC